MRPALFDGRADTGIPVTPWGKHMLRNALEPWHLILLLVVCVLVFGSKKLPDMARSVGKSMRILKSETQALRGEGGDRPQQG
ncbi:Sec-independent protein translocase subunit TatA [Streptomyces sp. NBC_00272]|uniref:Sec-independent protein translocase subunit TatA n=2 Tax=Streptomyces TaxID=1883 RepID=UPI002E2A4AD6|nr:Sec-independent protein translocase subunit TatA [Streptomyces sp. NBC_00272]